MQNKDEGTQKGKTIHSFSLKEHHIMQKFHSRPWSMTMIDHGKTTVDHGLTMILSQG